MTKKNRKRYDVKSWFALYGDFMEQYFYWNCFLDRKKENLHDAKRDSSDIDVLFTWGCQDDISH